MCVKIGQGSFHRLMARPQGDNRTIDARLQQLHRSAVAQDMGRHPLRAKGDAVFARFSDIFVQQRLHAVGAELAAVRVRKESRCAPLPGLVEPAPKGLLCNLGERRTSLLAALANASHVGTVPQLQLLDDLAEPLILRTRGQKHRPKRVRIVGKGRGRVGHEADSGMNSSHLAMM